MLYLYSEKPYQNCPVHINVHGGGFVRPHVLRDEIYSAKVADAIRESLWMWITAWLRSIRTRKAFNETYEVCRWVFSMLEHWDADSKRVSMGGHSAGANLTAAVCLKAKPDQRVPVLPAGSGLWRIRYGN